MNKIKTSKAAKRLNIHPANFFLHLADLDASLFFEDVWPDIDEAWIKTVSASGGYNLFQSVSYANQPSEHIFSVCESTLSDAAVLVVNKLYRQHKWGSVSVSFDALVNLTHLSTRDLQEAIAELRKKNLLCDEGTGRKISLDSARRKEIEAITQKQVA